MQENIELNREVKIEFKSLAAQNQITMKDWLEEEAHYILNHDILVHRTEREEDRANIIISIDEDLKKEIKDYCQHQDVRIRDFWVECINRIVERCNS